MSDAPPHLRARAALQAAGPPPTRLPAALSSSTAASSSAARNPRARVARGARPGPYLYRAPAGRHRLRATARGQPPRAPGGCGDGGSLPQRSGGLLEVESIASRRHRARLDELERRRRARALRQLAIRARGLRSRSKASLTGALQAGCATGARRHMMAPRAARLPSGLRAPLLGRPYGGPEVSLSEELRRAADPIWRAQHDHPFVRGDRRRDARPRAVSLLGPPGLPLSSRVRAPARVGSGAAPELRHASSRDLPGSSATRGTFPPYAASSNLEDEESEGTMLSTQGYTLLVRPQRGRFAALARTAPCSRASPDRASARRVADPR